MYYRVAIQRGRDHLDRASSWQWKSTVLSSLQSLFLVLRLYSTLPQEHLRVFSSTSMEDLEEQLVQENSGGGSSSVTAGQFLQARMFQVSGVSSAPGMQNREQKAPIAITIRTRLDKSNEATHTPGERSMSPLERRRLEFELGPGSDHDVPYSFCLPLSMPQVLAWMRLMGKFQRGELQP